MFGDLFNNKYNYSNNLSQKQKQKQDKKETLVKKLTKEDLNNEIDRIMGIYKTNLIDDVVKYMNNIVYFTEEYKFDSDFELINKILDKYYVKKVNEIFNNTFSSSSWKN